MTGRDRRPLLDFPGMFETVKTQLDAAGDKLSQLRRFL
jgi:hypothetical protein